MELPLLLQVVLAFCFDSICGPLVELEVLPLAWSSLMRRLQILPVCRLVSLVVEDV